MKNEKVLLFLTDKFPYGNSEAFIENELPILAAAFDKVFVIPTGLTVDNSIIRKMPENCILVPAPNQEYLYRNEAPTSKQRLMWTVKYMLGWSIRTLFSPEFYKETARAKREVKITTKVVKDIIRVYAPELRNIAYLRRYFKNYKSCKWNLYIYSYWLRESLCSTKKYICFKTLGQKPVKTICRAHSADLYSFRKKSGYLPFRTKAMAEADLVYTISNNGFNYLKNEYAEYKNKIKLSYLGTKKQIFDCRKMEKRKKLIVSCSYVVPVKRIDMIIDTLAQLKTDDFKWVHLGGGSELDKMKEYARERLEGKIEFLFKGNMSNNEIINFYRENEVDLFVNFSEVEGLPVSIMEAMSFGIPVAATDVGGTSDAVISGYNGFLIDKHFEIDRVAELIDDFLLMEEEQHQKMKNNALALWEERFNADKNYAEFVKELRL